MRNAHFEFAVFAALSEDIVAANVAVNLFSFFRISCFELRILNIRIYSYIATWLGQTIYSPCITGTRFMVLCCRQKCTSSSCTDVNLNR